MKLPMRRIRAAVGIGVTWGAAMFGVGLLLAAATGFTNDAPFPLLFGAMGFLAGIVFSGLLAATQGGRTLEHTSFRRMAGWGALGGALLSGLLVVGVTLSGEPLWGEALAIIPSFTLAGAACAAGSLALARRATRRDAMTAGEDLSDVGLTERAKETLLGTGTTK